MMWRYRFCIRIFTLLGIVPTIATSGLYAQSEPVWERPGLEGSRFHAVTVQPTRSGYRYSTATLRFGDDENSPLPETRNGMAEVATTHVDVFTELPDSIAQSYAVALAQADHLISAQTGVFATPGHHYTIYVTDADAPTNRSWQFSRSIHDPVMISLIVRADRLNSVLVSQEIADPVHERYHLVIEMMGRGRHDSRADDNAVAAYVYEEVAAFLHGSCASLLSLGYVTQFHTPGLTLRSSIDEAEEFEAPFNDGVLAALLEIIEAGEIEDGTPVPHGVHLGLNLTLWAELSGGRWYIESGSPEADAVLEACRYSAPDPFRIGPWLRQLSADGRDAPGMEERYEAFDRLAAQIQRD